MNEEVAEGVALEVTIAEPIYTAQTFQEV